MNQHGQRKEQPERTKKGQGERKRKRKEEVAVVGSATERKEKGSKHVRRQLKSKSWINN